MNDPLILLLQKMQSPLYLFLLIYTSRVLWIDVLKEFVQKRLNMKYELDKKNKETAAFNAENAFKTQVKDTLLDISTTMGHLSMSINRLNDHEANTLSLFSAENELEISMENSQFKILSEIRRIFEVNSRMNADRQKSIRINLDNYISSLMDESKNKLSKLFYKGISLAAFYDTITIEHRKIFRENIYLEIFSNQNDEKALKNTQSLILQDFRTHIIDSKKYLNKL